MYAAFLVCNEQKWKYREDWCAFSKWEQIHWMGFMNVKAEFEEKAAEQARKEAERR